ncbi:Cytochrome c oxidase assembly protein CtaG [BD1-7 clade bacterium]|uniref:Cytochrome c oxidase assembly protein CtaG n=1 Tax=BD1-7 clade bacterium TaxID=2029982 RepID=A0A5S9QZB9_9GAMM|nr:Cytochrome c oxidase assembly protein CtaG [BD1-7 clade bacterium]
MEQTTTIEKRKSRVLAWLLLGVVFMFAFAFALVPLYDTLCQALGINGKIADGPQQMQSSSVVAVNPVNLQMVVTNNGIDWTFFTEQPSMSVEPGKEYHIDFHATNHGDQSQTIQAIANVTPTELAQYVIKMECFCFTEQTLGAGESAVLPLVLSISPDIPEAYSTLTLSYTLYER